MIRSWRACRRLGRPPLRTVAKCWPWKDWSNATVEFFTKSRVELGFWFEPSLAVLSHLGKSHASFTPTTYPLEAMNTELLGLDLNRSVSVVDVPVLFFVGRYDQHANAKLAATYFETLRAPVKRVQWFEKSAHNIPFEE